MTARQAVYVCPACGTTRKALSGAELAHPCSTVRVKKGSARFVTLVEQTSVCPVDDEKGPRGV